MIFEFATGRTYNGPQVLRISAPKHNPEASFDDVLVVFEDASRGIEGTVTLFNSELTSKGEIGRAVLREYDACRYDLH